MGNDLLEKIEALEERLKLVEERILQLSINMANMSHHIATESQIKQQQAFSLFNGIF